MKVMCWSSVAIRCRARLHRLHNRVGLWFVAFHPDEGRAATTPALLFISNPYFPQQLTRGRYNSGISEAARSPEGKWS